MTRYHIICERCGETYEAEVIDRQQLLCPTCKETQQDLDEQVAVLEDQIARRNLS